MASSTAENRKRTGLFGALGARNPVGKLGGLLVAGVLIFGCWKWAAYRCGPVGWAEKGLYAKTAWDATVERPLHLIGPRGVYRVAVERSAYEPLLTNEAYRAGRRWRWKQVSDSPEALHRKLGLYVYEDDLLRLTWPLWLLPFPLLATGFIVGWGVDMRRLQKGRHTGVWLRGNHLVDARGWNGEMGA